MKRSIEETANRFDEMSTSYDEGRSDYAVATATAVLDTVRPTLEGDETVLDLGTGTGVLALELAPVADHVYALDISEGMRIRAREKAAERGIDNITFGHGTFRAPREAVDLPGNIDVVVSNFAMHHLADSEKATALDTIRGLLDNEGRFVLGDVIVFDEADVSVEHYDPDVDDPATIDHLVDLFEERGFSTRREQTGPMAGVVDASLS